MAADTAPSSMDADAHFEDNGVTTSELSKTYKHFKAIDSLSITICPGDIFGFLGPNGAGKTTTIRMLCGLVAPTAGTAKVCGFDIKNESAKIKNLIGLLPESSGYYGWMNAEEYLVHFALLYNIDPSVARKKATQLLQKVGLADKAFAPISYYSRGMKQRLGLARALINDPRIIFLDEPTLGLDPGGQVGIRKILIELNREKGVTIFLSSHALGEVSSLCNKIAIIDRGRLVAQGSMNKLRIQAGLARKVIVRVADTSRARQSLLNLPHQAEITMEQDDLISILVSATENDLRIDGNNHENNRSNADCIIDYLIKQGVQIYDIQRLDSSLEEIFFNLTGKQSSEYQSELREVDAYK